MTEGERTPCGKVFAMGFTEVNVKLSGFAKKIGRRRDWMNVQVVVKKIGRRRDSAVQEVQVHRCYDRCSASACTHVVVVVTHAHYHDFVRRCRRRSVFALPPLLPKRFPVHAVTTASAFAAPKPRQILQPPPLSDRNLPGTDLR
uniref:Uncharacterized protein n=1 Tax=Oryza nivara TaxID=4536 RepID=A0A0E0IAY9_ORYNI